MLTIIKPRGDIKSNWESANPTLRMREWGIEWETTVGVGEVKIKIGDGTTPWLNLDYVIVNDITKKIVRTFAEVTAENPELTEGSAIDVLWAVTKKKFEFLNQKVTDISENGDIDLTEVALPTFTDYATDDSAMPDARTAISNITSSIKVPAFISNAKAALRGLVTLGEMRSLLVNSGMTTEAGKYFLDAAYGKTLADQISQLNSHLKFIDNPPDWNELGLNSKGIIISAIGYYQGENIIGFPDGAYKYGCLLTINTYNANSPERPYRNAQIYIPHNGSTVGNILPIYVRTFGDIKDTSGSRVWRKIVASELVDAYAR